MRFLLHLMLGISIVEIVKGEAQPINLPQYPAFCGTFPKRWLIWSKGLMSVKGEFRTTDIVKTPKLTECIKRSG